MRTAANVRAWSALAGAAVFALAGASAQEPGHHPPHMGTPAHYDVRYNHNQYYAGHGVVVTQIPGKPVVVTHAGAPVYYSGGVSYAPHGPSFVVVAAPVGVFVPVLPPYYTTFWFGGAPYYYANETYYSYRGPDQGYEVVDPPGGPAAQGQGMPVPADMAAQAQAIGEDLFIYPQNGQPPDVQANDRYECHHWAASQTGFDPTQPGSTTNLPPDQLSAKRAEYQRAQRACLEGRGYSVR